MALRDPLTADEIKARLDEHDGWTGDTEEIKKVIQVGYDDAIGIVTEIGKVAIELEHRPDIDIRWDTLTITMTTHTAGDVVTALDFLLADRIDTIAIEHGATSVRP